MRVKDSSVSSIIFSIILISSFIMIIYDNQRLDCETNNKDINDQLLTKNLDKINVLWNNTWGGYSEDRGIEMEISSSGNMYYAGLTNSFGAGDMDFVLIKFLKNETMAFNRTWGGLEADFGNGMTLDNQENIYLTGLTQSFGDLNGDLALVKFTPNGTKIWQTIWDGSSADWGYNVIVNKSGDIYCIGSTYSYGNGYSDFLLTKFFSNGTFDWYSTWGGVNPDEAYDIDQDSNGFFYAVGFTQSYGIGNTDLSLVKFHPNGTKMWNVTWGGSQPDIGFGLTIDSNNNIYCTGMTNSFGKGNFDLFVAKFFPNGTRDWNITWGTPNSDSGNGLALDLYGNIYCIGTTNTLNKNNDLILIKFYPDGTEAWNISWGGEFEESGADIGFDNYNNLYCVGWTHTFGVNSSDIAFIKFDPNSPSNPDNPYPTNNERGVDINPILKVDLWDPNNDTLNVSFYNASDNTLIGRSSNIPSGCSASIVWTSLTLGKTYNWYAIADDGKNNSRSATWNFTTNFAPDPPFNPVPLDGVNKIGNKITLKVNISDPDGGALNVSFYNALNDSIIGIDKNISSGKTASINWTNLDWGNTYYWYTTVTDGTNTTQSPTWNFTTNFGPNKPINQYPTNNSIELLSTLNLSVIVADSDAEPLNISFYDASNDSLIEIDINVPSGGIASVNWTHLNYGTRYQWYAIVDDGKVMNKSNTWTFETNSIPHIVGSPFPLNNSSTIDINAILSAEVFDNDGGILTVSFYDKEGDSLIGMKSAVLSGTNASINWTGLEYNTYYQWYIVIDDGINRTKSSTWGFTTRVIETTTTSPPIPGFGLFPIISIMIIGTISSIIKKSILKFKRKILKVSRFYLSLHIRIQLRI